MVQPKLKEFRKWRLLPAPSCNKCENTIFTKRRAAFTFESVHVRSLQIYEYFMVAINSTIFILMHHALSDKMIFAVLDVWFGF